MRKIGVKKGHGRNADQSPLSSGFKAVRQEFFWGDEFQKVNGQDAADQNENKGDVASSHVAHRRSLPFVRLPLSISLAPDDRLRRIFRKSGIRL
jgi:hypothetical protein